MGFFPLVHFSICACCSGFGVEGSGFMAALNCEALETLGFERRFQIFLLRGPVAEGPGAGFRHIYVWELKPASICLCGMWSFMIRRVMTGPLVKGT